MRIVVMNRALLWKLFFQNKTMENKIKECISNKQRKIYTEFPSIHLTWNMQKLAHMQTCAG